jgi:hypothetical protein
MAGDFDGQRLRAIRLSNGCPHHSDVVAALRLQEVRLGTNNTLGVDASLICNWEAGMRPGIFYGARLCLLFGPPETIGYLRPRPRLLEEVASLRRLMAIQAPSAGRTPWQEPDLSGNPDAHHLLRHTASSLRPSSAPKEETELDARLALGNLDRRCLVLPARLDDRVTTFVVNGQLLVGMGRGCP